MSYMNMGDITKDDFEAIDGLFERFIPAHKEIWLFGTGLFGKAFFRYLKECGVTVKGFVVSQPKSANAEEEGLPVLSIEQFRHRCETEGGQALLLTVDEKYYDEILPKLMFMGDDLYFLKKMYKQLAADRCGDAVKIRILGFHIADHCNLSCYSCTAASPIAEKDIYEYEAFSDHIRKLRDLFGENVEEIYFTGGDVFQNPRFLDFITLSRKLFPDSRITFSSNGLDFSKQDDLFWMTLAENKVRVFWTLYPVEYRDYSETVAKAEKYHVDLCISGDSPGEDKTSWRIPFSEKGQQKIHDFLFCAFHRKCSVISNGLFYPCAATRQLKQLKRFFGIELPVRDGDYLDLDDIDKAEDIENWLKKRPPLCDFCALRERHSMGEWMPSQKKRSEWFLEE